MIIGGHSQTLLKEPAKINDTFIVQTGKGGFNVGVLNIQFTDKKINKLEETDSYIIQDNCNGYWHGEPGMLYNV